ncbi:MAG TPA: hypothetical protein VLG37_04580 [Candidatus Saccharimonadales bacterium]|nr:hypothetical protein [Candidatus Saccharimonadales bacterium]
MHEGLVDPGDKPPVPIGAAIANALEEWLVAEAEGSSEPTSRNAFLNDFDMMGTAITLPYNHTDNINGQKALNHYGRLKSCTNHLKELLETATPEQKDDLIARQIFCTQMFLSGAYRTQCFMRAKNAEEYVEARKAGIGINLRLCVEDYLAWGFNGSVEPDLRVKTIHLGDLVAMTYKTHDNGLETLELLHTFGRYYRGVSDSPIVEALKAMQGDWVRLAVGYIIFAAQERGGDLARVPFWEAKSISDVPKIYYPFAGNR